MPKMPTTAPSIVSIETVDSYQLEAVLKAVRQCLSRFGGIERFVRPGNKVLLKPNLLAAFHPERAITTHPAVVHAVTMLCLEAGAVVQIGDSPGIGELRQVFRRCQMEFLLNLAGVSLANFRDTVEYQAPDNLVARRIRLAKAVADNDLIITLPKLKTHSQMGFTGAIKNQYGLIVGSEKAHYHYRLKNRDWLAELMVDINLIAKPALAIMDGIVAMEGMGPAGGEARQLGVLLASPDISAVDTVACAIIDLECRTLPISQAAKKRGFGATELSEITVAGPPLEQLRVPDFKKIPELINILRLVPLPRFMLRWIRKAWAPRPRIIAEHCIKCNACGKGCPVEPSAINPFAGTEQVDDQRCIRCYCCHEFCPEKAIELKNIVIVEWLKRLQSCFTASSKKAI